MSGGGGGGGGGIEGKIYQPVNQGGIDTSWNNIFSGLQNQYAAGTSPGQEWLPYATQTGQNIYNNPFQNDMLSSAQNASHLQNVLSPYQLQGAQNLFNYGNQAMPYGQLALQAGQNPAYGLGQSVGYGLADETQPGMTALNWAGGQDLQTGYDPQHALYNRTQSQVADQVNAQLANSGLAGSPYGASVAGNTLSNFNLDWQDRQQQRQLAGGQGAAQMFGGAAQLGNNMLSDIMSPANQYGAAQGQAAQTFGQYGQDLQAGVAGSQNQEERMLQAMATYGALPYQQYNAIQGNNFSGIQNAINLGNAQYQLPEQLMGSGQSYMQLGQSANATAASNMLAQNQQFMQGLGGLGSLVGGLNNWGTSGSGGLLGSLFGGGMGAAGGDFGGGGAGMGVADVISEGWPMLAAS